MKTYVSRARGQVRLLAGSLAVLAVAGAQPAMAATATGSLSTSATVTSNCVVSTTAVAFGDVTGGLSVTCTSGTAWTATADAGAGTGASLATRKMTKGTDLLNYVLYTDSARTSVWGDGVTAGATGTFTGTGTGSPQASTIYGRVPSGQTSLPAGAYSDTVTVTVTY